MSVSQNEGESKDSRIVVLTYRVRVNHCELRVAQSGYFPHILPIIERIPWEMLYLLEVSHTLCARHELGYAALSVRKMSSSVP